MSDETFERVQAATQYRYSICYECDRMRLNSRDEAESHKRMMGCEVVADYYEARPVN